MAMPPTALTIAASDPIGGAGLQADLATFAALGVHGTSAVTAVTAQSLTEVAVVEAVNRSTVLAQIDAVIAIFELAALKTGMLRRADVVDLIAERVLAGHLPAPVVDPVMVDGRGVRLVDSSVEAAYRELLFPSARVITPNRSEAELLCGAVLPTPEEVLENIDCFRAMAPAVVVTGGAFEGDADDVLITSDEALVFSGRRIPTPNVRGSGCTFASAVAGYLAHGLDLKTAVKRAQSFVHGALGVSASWQLDGPGPISHAFSG